MTKQMIVRMAGAAVGILLGVLMLTIGFWRTLLLAALGAAGWALSGQTALKRQLSALAGRFREARRETRDS